MAQDDLYITTTCHGRVVKKILWATLQHPYFQVIWPNLAVKGSLLRLILAWDGFLRGPGRDPGPSPLSAQLSRFIGLKNNMGHLAALLFPGYLAELSSRRLI